METVVSNTVMSNTVISIRKYIISAVVSAVMGCSVMTAGSAVPSAPAQSSSLEQNSKKGDVFLTEKERSLGEQLILFGEFVRKYGQCTVYEQGKKEVCESVEAITIGEKIFLRKVVYNNTNGDEQYDSLEIHLSPFLHPPPRNEVRKMDLDLEGIMHIDLPSRRFLYVKKVATTTDYEQPPQKNNTVTETSCFNAQWQPLPMKNGECLYNTKE